MGFRKSKADTSQNIAWRKFYDENQSLMYKTGLPLTYLESRNLFDDFLMHGYIDHHEVKIEFSTDDMNEDQLNNFKTLVYKYFEAGFQNPGIVVLSHDETLKLEQKFPKQFNYK